MRPNWGSFYLFCQQSKIMVCIGNVGFTPRWVKVEVCPRFFLVSIIVVRTVKLLFGPPIEAPEEADIYDISLSNASASFKSAVSKPSVNQP